MSKGVGMRVRKWTSEVEGFELVADGGGHGCILMGYDCDDF